MSNKLKIYGCTGLENEEQSTIYRYWLDNTKTVSNTQAVNRLLALINYKYVQASCQLGLNSIQISELLDEIDILSICLYYAKEYANDPEKLHHAGVVIGAMVDKGIFKYESVDGKKRDEHLDDLFTKFEGFIEEEFAEIKDFMQWWKTEIEDKEVVGMSVDEQKTITKALNDSKVSGVGDADEKTIFDDPDIGTYITNAGTYFLYTYFTDKQLNKIPSRNKRIFQRKAITQNNLKDYCGKVFIQKAYGDEAYLDTLIRTGILKEFGKDPEGVCEDIANGKKENVGEVVTLTVSAIVEIIIACLGVVATIVSAICNAVAKIKVAKYESINKEATSAATPNESDYDGLWDDDSSENNKQDTGLGSNILLWIGGAAIAAYLLFRE